jgi:hypothetical protein
MMPPDAFYDHPCKLRLGCSMLRKRHLHPTSAMTSLTAP